MATVTTACRVLTVREVTVAADTRTVTRAQETRIPETVLLVLMKHNVDLIEHLLAVTPPCSTCRSLLVEVRREWEAILHRKDIDNAFLGIDHILGRPYTRS